MSVIILSAGIESSVPMILPAPNPNFWASSLLTPSSSNVLYTSPALMAVLVNNPVPPKRAVVAKAGTAYGDIAIAPATVPTAPKTAPSDGIALPSVESAQSAASSSESTLYIEPTLGGSYCAASAVCSSLPSLKYSSASSKPSCPARASPVPNIPACSSSVPRAKPLPNSPICSGGATGVTGCAVCSATGCAGGVSWKKSLFKRRSISCGGIPSGKDKTPTP